MSQPHFYQGDPYYQQQVTGLNPDKDLHETFIGVEPVSLLMYKLLTKIFSSVCNYIYPLHGH